jgi:SH3-like domain-containing protein
LTAQWAAAAPTMMSVQVNTTQIRVNPTYLGQMLATLAYGDRVEIIKPQGDWYQVRDAKSGKIGWVHKSALTTKQISMKAGDSTARTGASGEELALAGKGFNSDVEAEFKKKNQNIDFTWVDKMEEIKVSPKESEEFLQAGAVKPAGGAQ